LKPIATVAFPLWMRLSVTSTGGLTPMVATNGASLIHVGTESAPTALQATSNACAVKLTCPTGSPGIGSIPLPPAVAGNDRVTVREPTAVICTQLTSAGTPVSATTALPGRSASPLDPGPTQLTTRPKTALAFATFFDFTIIVASMC